MELVKRYVNEDLAEHWDVNESPKSFSKMLNHISITTNFKAHFEKELSYPSLFKAPKDSLIVADIGAGVGWTSAMIALRPEVKKVYVIEPSSKRLSRVPYVMKHFGIPESKYILINGGFENLQINEKINLAVLSSSFHHCFDNQMPTLFKNLKDLLLNEKQFDFIDYHGEKKNFNYKGKILIASEHFVNLFWTARKVQKYFNNIVIKYIKPKNYDPKISFGNWRAPDPFDGEHHRTKKEIIKIFKKANFEFDIVLHDGHSCVGENWNKVSKSVKYYFAILNLK